MNTPQMHSDFSWNDCQFSSLNQLLEYAEQSDTEVAGFLKQWFDTTPTLTVRTSGSTGVPKPIALSKEAMKASALATGTFFELPAKTSALICLSVNYIAGKMMWIRALELGWKVYYTPPVANPLQILENAVDFSAMVPMQLEASLNDLHKVKKLIVGGGAVSKELNEKIQAVSTEVYATYGMTETITHIAVKPLNRAAQKNGDSSVYNALPGVSFELDDRGCLCISAPRISDEMVVTNDVVQLNSATAFEWRGRVDNVINSGGIKLQPEHIEASLGAYIQQRFFVAGIPDKILGEKLVLLLEGVSFTTGREILKNLALITTMNRYEIPKEVFVLPKFIETETHKIQRSKCLEKALEKH
ncbi:O-succinylbenzoic acid--CoA ligase [Tenacibaculum litopenaei]|uniref:AMP-binding protein n=1 Tax=Tenacibaculum litopenaei TaxID=396016 RepID=UPI0038960F3C